MTEADKPILPEVVQDQLNQASQETVHNENAEKVFVGIPCMGDINIALLIQLFAWAKNPKYETYFHFTVEKRFTDYARNILVAEFLKTDCRHLAMIDADSAPHPNFLELTKHRKDIIAATTHCWLSDKILPSVWQRSECEQCINLKKWMEEGIVHDPREYLQENGLLYRWNPEGQRFERFANKSGILGGMKCRCGGTGFDPWVFKVWQQPFEPGKIKRVDSVGTASIIIRREVVEKMKAPHFQFYYRPSREILLTEDHYFCWKAQIEGFEVWADFDMIFSHFKRINLAGVNAAIVNGFRAGMEFQKKEVENGKYNIILPTDEEAKKFGGSPTP